MPRKSRVDAAGYHLVINRGVANRKIFYEDEDYVKFLEILCASVKLYNFSVHAYCFLHDHYYLLIETKDTNISLAIRYVNSNYAVFFNKKYNRSGHLWQGRYQSWYILNRSYLPVLVLYMEQHPVQYHLADKLGDYKYSSYRSFANLDEPYECLRQSFVFKKYATKDEIDKFFASSVIEKSLDDIIEELQKVVKYQKNISNLKQYKNIESYFNNIFTKKDRDKKIYEAYTDGYTQQQIASHLNISQATVSNSIKKLLKEKKSTIICI